LDEVDQALEEGVATSPRGYAEKYRHFNGPLAEKWSNNYNKWSVPAVYKECLEVLLRRRRRKKKNTASPFQEIETELYTRFREKRRKAHKVSRNWIRINELQIYNAKKLAEPEKWEGIPFKGSYGWTRRFMQRKKIKFKKRKNRKEKTADECISVFEDFLEKLRFDFLCPSEDDGPDARDPLWGRFPPHRRYKNMDQVPLPFVVAGQDETFTTKDDEDVNIKAPKESLRKQQFTMHLVFNAGTGEDSHERCDLVCKGTGKRIQQAEKDLWDGDINVLWQKKAWVDSVVM